MATFTGHDWRWVCSALASPRFPPPRLPMVDTVIIERGRPSLWLSLQPDGTVLSRPVGASSSQEIFNSFCAFSLGFARNRDTANACVAHYAVGLPQVRARRRARPLSVASERARGRAHATGRASAAHPLPSPPFAPPLPRS